MDDDKNISKKNSSRLNNYSKIFGLDRLSNPDIETASSLTAGGDKSFLEEDINDIDESKEKGRD